MNKLQFTGISDVGKKRSGNEDRYYVDWCWDEQHLLALCVDGCGGYAGGQIAAQMTVDNVCEFLNEHREGDKLNLLKQAVIYANNRVHEERNIEPDLHRMCCVLTAALIELEEERINMVHVGDTRLYAVTNGRVIKLSHDHSPIGRDEEAGLLTETEAMQHPSRNIIERAVGEKYLKADTDYIETESFPIARGITWLFCSDGLSDMITTAEMADILGQPITLNEKAKRLVEAAHEAGGKDNITIILVQAENEADEQTQTVMNHYATRITGEPQLNYNQQMTNLFREPDSEDETSEDTVYRKPNNMEGTETVIPQVVDVPLESTEQQTENELAKQPDSSDGVEVHANNTEESVEPPTAIAPPPLESEQTEKTKEVSVPETERLPQATSPKRYSYILAITLLILIPIAIMLYLYHKEVKAQEQWQRDEVIRQEILRRELYYNINDRIDLMNNDSIQIH